MTLVGHIPLALEAPPLDEDELLADMTLEELSYLQGRRSFDGLNEATILAHAKLAAALSFLRCEVGTPGVRTILDQAIAENDRHGARDQSVRRRRG